MSKNCPTVGMMEVQPGSLVEVRAPELPAGATVEVVVRLKTSTPALDDGLSQWIGAA